MNSEEEHREETRRQQATRDLTNALVKGRIKAAVDFHKDDGLGPSPSFQPGVQPGGGGALANLDKASAVGDAPPELMQQGSSGPKIRISCPDEATMARLSSRSSGGSSAGALSLSASGASNDSLKAASDAGDAPAAPSAQSSAQSMRSSATLGGFHLELPRAPPGIFSGVAAPAAGQIVSTMRFRRPTIVSSLAPHALSSLSSGDAEEGHPSPASPRPAAPPDPEHMIQNPLFGLKTFEEAELEMHNAEQEEQDQLITNARHIPKKSMLRFDLLEHGNSPPPPPNAPPPGASTFSLGNFGMTPRDFFVPASKPKTIKQRAREMETQQPLEGVTPVMFSISASEGPNSASAALDAPTPLGDPSHPCYPALAVACSPRDFSNSPLPQSSYATSSAGLQPTSHSASR